LLAGGVLFTREPDMTIQQHSPHHADRPASGHTTRPRTPAWRPPLAALVLALLSACGGGGGGTEDSATTRTLTINAGNRDAVAQTAAAAALGLGDGVGAVGLGAAPDQRSQGIVARSWAAHSGLLPAPVHRLLRERLRAVSPGEGMKRAQAVIGPLPLGCTFGGTGSVSMDDADNNGELSAGDTLTMRFDNCAEESGMPVNGQIVVQLARYTALPLLRMSGRMSFNNLTASDSEGSLTMNGTMGFDMAELDSNSDRMTVTAETPVTTRLATGTLSDTTTLGVGYQQTELYEYAVSMPGGQVSGRSTVTLSGVLGSTALGGSFSLATTTPFVRYDIDPYPSSGVLLVQGRTGTVRLTAQSYRNVLLELDADDNGIYESSRAITWIWLM